MRKSAALGCHYNRGDYIIVKTFQPDVWEFEHRIIASYALGRLLESGEIVHHIDGDGTNNDPANLKVFANTGEHIRHHHKGKQRSPEIKARMSMARKGKPKSEAHREAMSKAVSGDKHPQWGKTPSLETRAKISMSLKGRQFSPEARKKLSDGHKLRRLIFALLTSVWQA